MVGGSQVKFLKIVNHAGEPIVEYKLSSLHETLSNLLTTAKVSENANLCNHRG